MGYQRTNWRTRPLCSRTPAKLSAYVVAGGCTPWTHSLGPYPPHPSNELPSFTLVDAARTALGCRLAGGGAWS